MCTLSSVIIMIMMMMMISDVNECVELEGVCRGGVCTNTFGGFTCTCSAGYQLDFHKQICAGSYLLHLR